MAEDHSLRCPTCRKPVEKGAPSLPFCSERCRLVDLGRWFAEDFRVSRPLFPTIFNEETLEGEMLDESLFGRDELEDELGT